MSFAPNYTPTVGFSTEESNSVAGRSIVRTVAVDNELANISSSINGLNTNLKAIQRDDGKLKDGTIEPYALAEQTRALIASGGKPRGAWLSGQIYAVGDAVQYSNIVYLCTTPHTSAVSFASGLFMAISGDGSSFVSASESAASALASLNSANNAETYAAQALSYKNNAETYANASIDSATSSGNSATAAALSAAQAASVIASSTLGASQAEAEAFSDNSKYMSSLRVSQSFEKKLANASAVTIATNDKILIKDTSASDALKTITVQDIINLSFGIPVGSIIDFTGISPPTGYLACPITQTNISRTTYAALFAAIGTTWGVGDGSTTFGLPYFPADYSAIQANSNVGTNTAGQNLSHTHTEQISSSGSIIQPKFVTGTGLSAPVSVISETSINGTGGTSVTTGAITGSSGGAANLSAGVRVLKCIKY